MNPLALALAFVLPLLIQEGVDIPQDYQRPDPSARGGNRPPPGTSLGNFVVTSYCLQGIMRDGSEVNENAVAADPTILPLGSYVTVAGHPGIHMVQDTGSGVLGHWIDLWMSSCDEAVLWGRQEREVWLLPSGP